MRRPCSAATGAPRWRAGKRNPHAHGYSDSYRAVFFNSPQHDRRSSTVFDVWPSSGGEGSVAMSCQKVTGFAFILFLFVALNTHAAEVFLDLPAALQYALRE